MIHYLGINVGSVEGVTFEVYTAEVGSHRYCVCFVSGTDSQGAWEPFLPDNTETSILSFKKNCRYFVDYEYKQWHNLWDNLAF